MATATSTTTRKTAAKPKAAAAKKPAAPKQTPITVDALLDMGQDELDALFKASPKGEVPSGEGNGTVIVATGTPITSLLAPILRLGWQGKVIDGKQLTLKNKILPFGIPLIAAKIVKTDASRLDGKPTTVLDYSKTSLVARAIRDEIREVAPGLYLGVVYIYGRKTINFALEF
ncbi:MAG: hypothetical protein JHD16_06115 [Solirubrobacteraceae bacterium]|nr:hypothetical protein [Solirubrobacteraceae bacterium]